MIDYGWGDCWGGSGAGFFDGTKILYYFCGMTLQDEISKAAAAVRRGGIIVYPTDTVWGIGCDATDAEAVARIYALKKRTDAKALITLVGSTAQLERWVDGIPDVAYDLIEAAVKPLTIVYDAARGLASNLLAEDGSIGVRVTADPFCRGLCAAVGRPVVSTSANISGAPTPATFADIAPEIIAGADHVASWRRDDTSAANPSTVIKLGADATVKILRQ